MKTYYSPSDKVFGYRRREWKAYGATTTETKIDPSKACVMHGQLPRKCTGQANVFVCNVKDTIIQFRTAGFPYQAPIW